MNITVHEATQILHGQLILGDPMAMLVKASVDSRLVEPGDLFFALKGENRDGHEYAMSACRQKAGGIVVSKLDWLRKDNQFSSRSCGWDHRLQR
jgi:UDP-N-acetylmuramoyl-tripeptide--D-alanyl-D-alanine ligase